ncbi:hypothetical protein OIV83_002194 [Microbotryomycetes sp. JL201]|nr:hypothetical protein OIV83_002194 [Microbotryomycetes sp. JL201]
MPEFNVYAVSSLIGWQSTALSFFLLLPTLAFGYRDCVNYFDPSSNILWTFAELFSLVGLLLVPDPLVTQIILVAWYLAADLLLFAEACMIEGWFGVKVKRMQYARRRHWWEWQRTKTFLEKWNEDHRAKDEVAEEILRANDFEERTYAGARWRRDVEWQIVAVTLGLLIGPCVWYPLFYMNGQASQGYKWENSDISNFKSNELAGWISGIVSSALYLFARIQADYRFRNWVKSALNSFNRYHNEHEKRHVLSMKPPPDPYVVCATCIVVYLAFILDNLCQVVSILVICTGQDYQTRVRAKLDKAFEAYVRKWSPGNIDVSIKTDKKRPRGRKYELQTRIDHLRDKYLHFEAPPPRVSVALAGWRLSKESNIKKLGMTTPSSRPGSSTSSNSHRPTGSSGQAFELARKARHGMQAYELLQNSSSDKEGPQNAAAK